MKYYPTQQLDYRPASFWQLCILLLLLHSLVFIGWIDFRQSTLTNNSELVAEFDHVTLANHRDHFRSLLDIKNLPLPDGDNDDLEQPWLVYSTVLILPALALLNVNALLYLASSIFDDIKHYLPFTRAPPHS